MTIKQLEEKYPRLEKDGKVFIVSFKYDDMVDIYNENDEVIDYELIGFELLATPEDNYNNYINPKQPQPSPDDKISDLEKKVTHLESIEAGLLLENANHQIKLQEQEIKNKEQEVTNANLLLEIAMLKGVI